MMKKTVPVLLMSAALLCGCSYFSKINPFGGDEQKTEEMQNSKVNAFLWQAATEKLGFMPLEESSESDGLIITAWTGLQGYPDQKFKLEARVTTKALRADGIDVTGLSRTREGKGWREEPLKPEMCQAIELEILEQARILYRKSLAD